MSFDVSADVRSLYIHWPFCPYRCSYCPFVALAAHDDFMPRYHRALLKEINGFADKVDKKYKIETIYIGGGTPSTYPRELLLDMFDTLKNRFNFSKINEVTLEVNPGTVDKNKLKDFKSAGVNRLSVGVQSLNDAVLKNLNRNHTVKDVYNLLDDAQLLFENISIDLIVGLPGVLEKEWKDTVKEVCKWPVKHVSLYFLSIHENTKLYFDIKRKNVKIPSDNFVIKMYEYSAEVFQKNGFERYEISNFSKNGFESKHNKMYWNRKAYKAFGVGACSFDGSCRFENENSLMMYLKAVEFCKNVVKNKEYISRRQMLLEELMLKIRQNFGVFIQDFIKKLNVNEKKHFEEKLNQLKLAGLVDIKNDCVVLTKRGITLENEVVVELFPGENFEKNIIN